nr:Chain C, GP41 PEPTIDE [Human immunodeficiency virus 1]
ELDKWAN